MSIIIDLITIVLAIYTLVLYGKRIALDFKGLRWWGGMLASATYLVAQTGWTAAYLSGNFWGAALNNYIWFAFNTIVFLLLICWAKGDE